MRMRCESRYRGTGLVFPSYTLGLPSVRDSEKEMVLEMRMGLSMHTYLAMFLLCFFLHLFVSCSGKSICIVLIVLYCIVLYYILLYVIVRICTIQNNTNVIVLYCELTITICHECTNTKNHLYELNRKY